MDILWAILLGLIQGLTEWLPISSSGHLALAQYFMGNEPPLIFDIMIHVGTVLVLITYFRKDIVNLLRSLTAKDKGSRRVREGRALAWYIIIAIIPTGVIGLIVNYTIIDLAYGSLFILGTGFMMSGVILLNTMNARPKRGILKMTSKDAAFIGVAQGIAILPAISRSGSTIGIGMIRGLDRETAGRFSFLLAIPSVLGALVLRVKDLFDTNVEVDLPAFAAGTVVAMIVGYLSLALLMRILKGRGFHYFAYYCFGIGAITLALGMLGY